MNAIGVSKIEFIFSFTTNKHVYLITDLGIYSVNKYRNESKAIFDILRYEFVTFARRDSLGVISNYIVVSIENDFPGFLIARFTIKAGGYFPGDPIRKLHRFRKL